MKILHVTWGMRIGGLQRSLFQLVTAQREAGVDADLAVASKTGFYSDQLVGSGAKVVCLGQRFGLDFSVVPSFLRLAKNYDALHFHIINIPLVLCTMFLKKQKFYFSRRGGVHAYGFKKTLYYKIIAPVIRRKYRVSGNTLHAAREAERLFKLKRGSTVVTYNGLDFSLLEPRTSRKEILNQNDMEEGKVYIGTAAALNKWKRMHILIEAIAGMKPENLGCIIIGDGPKSSELYELVQKLGLTDQVKFFGKQEHVGDFLQVMDIFVLPSGQGESFGNSAVEAMGMGIPTIVMADGGGLLEHIPEGSGLVARNVDHLAHILDDLVMNPELRNRLGNQCKVHVHQKYSIENMLAGYQAFYLGGPES